jgi:transcription antitermination factor NusG
MSENEKWYAVYTRPRWEKKVAEILTRRKIENYCPINKVVRQWSDRKKMVHEPLFTSYVFVRISEKELIPLKQTDGVINLVYWLGKPAVIRDAEIEMIKRFLSDYNNVKLEKTHVSVNDTIRILGGPLMEQEGQVLSVGKKSVRILLPSLGYLMFVEVETANVEVILKTIPTHTELSYPLYAVK